MPDQNRFVARLDRLPRLGRVLLCGLVTLMTMPILSALGLHSILLVLVGVGVYALGWMLWLGFKPELPQVGLGALLYLLAGVGALLLWAIYNIVLLVLVSPV